MSTFGARASFRRLASVMKVARWSDLPSRLYSGVVLGFVGFLAIFFGGIFLQLAESL